MISGDIANTGSPEEYATAKRFLEGLSEAIAKHRPGAHIRYLSIPGNHDCYLPETETGLRAVLVAGIQSTFQTDTPDESILGSLLDKQQNYFEFQRQLGQGVNTVIEKLFRLSVLDIGGFRIQFALYNRVTSTTGTS